jgi:hypothetical protein
MLRRIADADGPRQPLLHIAKVYDRMAETFIETDRTNRSVGRSSYPRMRGQRSPYESRRSVTRRGETLPFPRALRFWNMDDPKERFPSVCVFSSIAHRR